MAGMLAGVEAARRRRFHQSGVCSDSSASAHNSTRRSSFCWYASNHEFHPLSSSSSSMSRDPTRQAFVDEKLDDAARQAKERLDERLNALRKSDNKRASSNRQQLSRNCEGAMMRPMGIHREVVGSKRFGWGKKQRWKSSEQEECAVCLEQYKGGESLMHLPCAHRFHSRCVMPWLQTNSHCPCCRFEISVSHHN